MHASISSVARLALVLAAVTTPALAQQPDTTRRVTKEPVRTTTDTARGVVTPATPSVTTPSDSAPSAAAPSAALSAEANAIVASLQTDAHAMALLHHSNLAEIQAGNLAQQRAQDAEVKAFAQHMVTDHTALDQQGDALATRLNVSPMLPDSALPRAATQAMSTLSSTGGAASGAMTPSTPTTDAAAAAAGSGAEFDRAYITQQVADHQRTLALVDAAIERSQNAELKTALQTQVRPKVAEHLQHARQLQQKLGGR